MAPKPEQDRPSTPALPSTRRQLRLRRKAYAILVPFLLLLILWIWFFVAEGAFEGGPNGKSFEADFAMFVGAARVLQQGGNPYEHQMLYRSERAWLAGEGLPITKKASIVRVGNPPLFFWALEPFSGVRFAILGYIWGALLYLVSGAGFLILLGHLGWRRHMLPLLIFALLPQVFLGAFYGNVVAIVFLAVSCSVALARRYPFVAGLLLVFAWLKPPVALPVAMLIFLFHTTGRVRLLGGFAAASLAGLALTIMATGSHTLRLWVAGMVNYSRDITFSPDISSLAGLYVRPAPPDIRLGLELLSLLTAGVLTYVMWRRFKAVRTVPVIAVGWLWLLWFLATPYAHFFDEILLTLPVLAFLGPNGRLAVGRDQAASLYVLFISLLLIEWAPYGIQLLSLPLVAVTLALEKASREARAPGGVAREAA